MGYLPARAILGIWVLIGLTGCSVTRKIAVGQMVPILENAAAGARESRDLDLVEQGLPANLLLLDGMIRTDPKNRDLLAIGAFMYFSYALGFAEPKGPELASHYYGVGRDYGLRALDRRRQFERRRRGSLEDFERALQSLGRRDVPALAWAAANWGRWISLNLESPAAIAQQPRLAAMLARLLELEPAYEAGLGHVLLGMYDAMRPEMFGGKPDSAYVHFQKAFEISERKNLLYLVFYAEFYCRQVLDVECFDATLDEVAAAAGDLAPEFRLMNEMARRRAERLRALRDELF
ncbi:MAG: TRAP transporter TatT component family protein [Candidatus Krumholzibacteriia bacterium]